MANLKMGVSKKQSTPNFLNNKHFVPPDMNTFCFSTDDLMDTSVSEMAALQNDGSLKLSSKSMVINFER